MPLNGISFKRSKIVCVVGTRPEAIKMAPVIEALRKTEWAEVVVVSTGQHSSLTKIALQFFGINIDLDLELMTENQSLAQLSGRLFDRVEPIIKNLEPDLVIAQGDTTTVMAVAMVSFYLDVRFAHLEAGLRTNDNRNPFPEELNRRICGYIADLHFAPTKSALNVLVSEGVARDAVTLTGNTVIDALMLTPPSPKKRDQSDRKLILMTAHRRENMGDPLKNVFKAVRDVVLERNDVEVLYPVHPNPNVNNMAHKYLGNLEHVNLTSPLDYGEFVNAMRSATIVISDSGGVQEEAPALGKPVLVIRDNTERPEAVTSGGAQLIGTRYENVVESINTILDDSELYAKMSSAGSPYGDGYASDRVVDAIKSFLGISNGKKISEFEFDIN